MYREVIHKAWMSWAQRDPGSFWMTDKCVLCSLFKWNGRPSLTDHGCIRCPVVILNPHLTTRSYPCLWFVECDEKRGCMRDVIDLAFLYLMSWAEGEDNDQS